LSEIVKFAVIDENKAPIRRDERLVCLFGKIENAQASIADAYSFSDPYPLVVWTAMELRILHAA
jgi:hypothetical protein